MELYERINELCQKNGITGIKLGELLGLKKSPLTDWKNGKAKPTIEQIIRMCEIFATTTEYIILGKQTIELNEKERERLEAYQRADVGTQKSVRKLLDIPENKSKSSESQNGKVG